MTPDTEDMVQAFMMFIILPLLSVAIVLTVWRLVVGPTFADRVIALDKLSVIAIGILLAYGMALEQTVYIDIALLIAMLSFLATVGFGYYIERRA